MRPKNRNIMNFITLLDYVGTFAFAISGIRLASAKHFDWFGAYVVGFVTAVGGGTLRDLLLGLPPFWMQNVLLPGRIGIRLPVRSRAAQIRDPAQQHLLYFRCRRTGTFHRRRHSEKHSRRLSDVGGYHQGTLTGAAGGMLRDVLLNEVPLIFRKDIYAIACICGGLIYYLCMYLDLPAAPHAVHRRLLGDPHSDSGGTVRHLPSGTQGRNQTGTQREITNRFRKIPVRRSLR